MKMSTEIYLDRTCYFSAKRHEAHQHGLLRPPAEQLDGQERHNSTQHKNSEPVNSMDVGGGAIGCA